MKLGERLYQARIEAGLTQRQLCGEVITRNMLSQIENGKAQPSMKTLQYLAQALGKPVSYFLEETGISENQAVMLRARDAFGNGLYSEACSILTDYRGPDPSCDWEMELLKYLSLMAQAEAAAEAGREPLARKLVKQTESLSSPYITRELKLRRLRLPGGMDSETGGPEKLPSLDADLRLRSCLALEEGDGIRAGALLDAMEERTDGQWHLLRGRAYLIVKNFSGARSELLLAEREDPEKAIPFLEQCFRELGDFENAYLYACKQRSRNAGG